MATVTGISEAYSVDIESTVRYVAAVLAFTSQVIHLRVLPSEIVFAFLPGLIFLVIAIGQGLLGVRLLFGPGKWAIRLGILLNLSVAAVWVLTRFVSLPNATGAVTPEVELLGLAATIAEVSLVVVLLLYARL